MKILALDTATELCSVALMIDEAIVARELETDRGHAEYLLPMIDAVLAEAGVSLRTLDAIAFGRGPGGFTGVRLAASVTQGLAFAASLPVIPVSDLAAVAQRVFDEHALDRVLVCNDARMREVYWASFGRGPMGRASLVLEEQVSAPARVATPQEWGQPVGGAGRGFRVYPELQARVCQVFDNLLPRAQEIVRLAVGAPRVLAEQAIPVYLRDDVAKPSS